MTFTDFKYVGLASIAILGLAACDNDNGGETKSIEEVETEQTPDNFGGEIDIRTGEIGNAYDAGEYTVTINSVDILENQDNVSFFDYQGVHVNASIENNTDEDQEFDVWSQLRVGSIVDRDAFGALQRNVYDEEEWDIVELNDDLFIELESGEEVTYDFLYDVIVPEEDNDVAVIYQINAMNQYEDGYIVWEIEGFDELEPSEVEEIDWDEIEEEGEEIEDPESDDGEEPVEEDEDNE